MNIEKLNIPNLKDEQNKTINSVTSLTQNLCKIDYYGDFMIDEILKKSET